MSLSCLVISDAGSRDSILSATLREVGYAEMIGVDDLTSAAINRRDIVAVDVDLGNSHNVTMLRRAAPLAVRRPDCRFLFVTGTNRLEAVQAQSLGADVMVRRPLRREEILEAFSCLRQAISPPLDRAVQSVGLALNEMMTKASRDELPTLGELKDVAGSIDDALRLTSLAQWVESAMSFHLQTQRHVLLVAGLANGFAIHLGFRRDDRARLAEAALLHDVGKARIPLSILDKSGPLTSDEMAVMRTHAAIGGDFIAMHYPREHDLCDVARHHHELLDGSGYPDGLAGARITDPVRLITICDIFAALIEERPYKKAFSSTQAYEMLGTMRGKLDPDLIREFKGVALAAKIGAQPAPGDALDRFARRPGAAGPTGRFAARTAKK